MKLGGRGGDFGGKGGGTLKCIDCSVRNAEGKRRKVGKGVRWAKEEPHGDGFGEGGVNIGQ